MNTTPPATGHSPNTEAPYLQLTRVVVWPLAAVAAVTAAMLIYSDKSGLREIELSPKGVKIIFNLLEAAERGGPSGQAPSSPLDVKEIQEIARKSSGFSLAGTKVLWVDDNPQDQTYERRALEVLGIEFILAKSTSEAIPLLMSQNPKLVITDFKRVDDENAGYTLLEEARKLQPNLPVIIYSGAVTPELEAEAKKRGAFGETNQPQRLFGMAVEAIVGRK